MKIKITVLITFIFTVLYQPANAEKAQEIDLPKPLELKISLTEAINARKTTRSFNEDSFSTLEELSTLLYTMQGKTHGNKRAVPSAHSRYPLELYVVVNNVKGLNNGLYKFSADDFKLKQMIKGDLKSDLASACAMQSSVKKSQIRIIITVVWNRLTDRMGEGSRKYGIFEAGSASQNSYLAAAAMGINTVPVGGMNPEDVAKFLKIIHDKETPVIVNCYGR